MPNVRMNAECELRAATFLFGDVAAHAGRRLRVGLFTRLNQMVQDVQRSGRWSSRQRHSRRRAVVGSMPLARWAGIQLATPATSRKTAVTPAKIVGSTGLTPARNPRSGNVSGII